MRQILTVKELITLLLEHNMDAHVYVNANGIPIGLSHSNVCFGGGKDGETRKEANEVIFDIQEEHSYKEVRQEDMEYLFPELAESKDERIRKALIDYFNHHKNGINIFYDIKGDDVIAWLEKQGETKEYTFKSLTRLLDMIEPSDRAKAYCQKLIFEYIGENNNGSNTIHT